MKQNSLGVKLSSCDIVLMTVSSEMKEHLKPGVHRDRDSITDHWDKRRKLFKESREWSSAGGNSTTSDFTDDSGNF